MAQITLFEREVYMPNGLDTLCQKHYLLQNLNGQNWHNAMKSLEKSDYTEADVCDREKLVEFSRLNYTQKDNLEF